MKKNEMKKYIEIKILKRNLVIIGIFTLLGCSIGGYYFWCAYHPEITINISDGPTGKEGIKIEAPNITVAPKGIAKPSSSIELKTTTILMQHEFFCSYIRDTYEISDIKLEMEVQGNETILKYSGTATAEDGQINIIEKEFDCEFALDANIIDSL